MTVWLRFFCYVLFGLFILLTEDNVIEMGKSFRNLRQSFFGENPSDEIESQKHELC